MTMIVYTHYVSLTMIAWCDQSIEDDFVQRNESEAKKKYILYYNYGFP